MIDRRCSLKTRKGFSQMSEQKSPIEELLKELNDPADYTAAAIGGAIGFIATATVLGGDGGTFAAGGALGAVAARRALMRPFLRGSITKRLRRLMVAIQSKYPDYAPASLLVKEINADIELLRIKSISPDTAERNLKGYAETFKKICKSD